MAPIASVYERDLDLNLLRVFVVVAEAGSVTEAAQRLYLTQPAISAALRRLAGSVGQPLFARAGRGLVLTARGSQLLQAARPHLAALVGATLSGAAFDPKTSDETVRLGLSDSNETWLLQPLLRVLAESAPRMRIVISTTQFRTVGESLLSGSIDLAVTVADDLPAGMRREPLFYSGFVCLFDPRQLPLPKKLSLERYLAEDHVIVSYNGDLRGVVEDMLGLHRRVRVSLPTFHSVGSAVHGTRLIATIPEMVASEILRTHPSLKAIAVPFDFAVGAPMELVWRAAQDDAAPQRFIRAHVQKIAKGLGMRRKA